MDRMTKRCKTLLGLVALAALLASATGCRMLFTTVAYLIKGTQVEADYDGLSGKKIAVVCRPGVKMAWGNPAVADDLARQVGTLLRANLSKKTQVIDQQKVAAWLDEHEMMDYAEVGKALKADMVLGIDLLDFSLLQGQTLYQGKANVELTVYDCKNGDKQVYQKSMPQTLWPPNGGIATSEMPEPQFRRKFVLQLADQIGRHFYPHDKQSDFARDTDAL